MKTLIYTSMIASTLIASTAFSDSTIDCNKDTCITTEQVAQEWKTYQTTSASCVDAVSIAIGESGATKEDPTHPGQRTCDGKCIDVDTVNPQLPTIGVWQIHCPTPDEIGLVKEFKAKGIDCMSNPDVLKNPATNARAAHAVIKAACQTNNDFCSSQWTGGASYYKQFTTAAQKACKSVNG